MIRHLAIADLIVTFVMIPIEVSIVLYIFVFVLNISYGLVSILLGVSSV